MIIKIKRILKEQNLAILEVANPGESKILWSRKPNGFLAFAELIIQNSLKESIK